MNEEDNNPDLFKVVTTDNKLKSLLIEYVGEQLQPENNEVTVEMVIEVVAKEFPELILVIAEENFVRGYQQAATDIKEFEIEYNGVTGEEDASQ